MPSREKREEVRKKFGDLDNAFIKIPLPFPKDTILEKELVDFSEHGASFSITRDEGYLLPKTPLENISISYKDKAIKVKNGTVVYSARINSGSDWVRMGIQFGQNGYKEQGVFPVRPERYENNFFGNLEKYVSLKDEAGIEYLCDILNVSRYGIAFSIKKDDIIFKKSSVINGFRVIINNEVLFDGNVVISHIIEDEDYFNIGAEFRDDILHIKKIAAIRRKEDIKRNLIDYVENSIFPLEQINAQFKQKIADIGYIFSSVKNLLDQEEKKFAVLKSSDREDLSRIILENVASRTFSRINSLLEKMNILCSDFNGNSKDNDMHKEYFQSHLNPYFMLAPVLHRIFKKPLGFAGDYEMMNMLYQNAYEGPTLFAKYVNKYACQVKPAQTNRNRVAYLTQKIQKTAEVVIENKGRTAKIMTIGCGPAIEFQKFVELDGNSNHTEVTLVDFEKEALIHAKEKIMELKIKHSRELKIHPRFFSILQLIKDYKRGKELFEKQDLIYCSGLFEYLNVSTCKTLIKLFYHYLNENGNIIIGNFDETNNYRYFMDYCGEWYLNYRNEEIMINLASKIKDAKKIYVEKEETKLNDFLVIEK